MSASASVGSALNAALECFIEVDSFQRAKSGQMISGDVFLTQEVREEGRIVAVLSDGLGSGVKASVLASMTAMMALKFAVSPMDMIRAAEIIMDTLPICSERQISYSTFTIVDMAENGETRVIEHGNPSFLLIRPDGEVAMEQRIVRPRRWEDRLIRYSTFRMQREDRLIFFSDGVTQAGTGNVSTPLGWGLEAADEYARALIQEDASISAREISRLLVEKAGEIDGNMVKDDTTCAAIYYRNPRELLILTGPPFNRMHDFDMAMIAAHATCRKVICGGTTANLISKRLKLSIENDVSQPRDGRIPPAARMQGFEMVTEGVLTLSETLRMLEDERTHTAQNGNAAAQLVDLLLNSDVVRFVVGTSVNEAHHDPELPVELELIRSIVKRLIATLEGKYRKRVLVQYL